MAEPLIHHRTPEFKEVLNQARAKLQQIFRTRNEMLILTSSGTGAMEAAVSNLHSPGEKVLAVVAGKFGERWEELAKAYGLTCITLTKEYGEAASAREILALLQANPDVKSVLIQGCETSTATAHDLEAIAKAVKSEFPEVLLVVDAITAVGCQAVETDAWGLDVVICGSQKAFGLPPGLAFISLSPAALKTMEKRGSGPFYYFDLRKELKNQKGGATAYTPAISLIVALNKALDLMLSEGLDSILATAGLMALSTRKALEALGFRILSEAPANAATAAFPPAGMNADDLRKQLETEMGVKVAGGQGKLKGNVIRIAHLGYFDILDVVSVVAAIELVLVKRGVLAGPGAGVQVALQEMAKAAATS